LIFWYIAHAPAPMPPIPMTNCESKFSIIVN
jgi:hypothetical protein